MLKTEKVKIGNREFFYTISTSGYYIERDGVEYVEAYDIEEKEYIETDKLIPIPEEEELAKLIKEARE